MGSHQQRRIALTLVIVLLMLAGPMPSQARSGLHLRWPTWDVDLDLSSPLRAVGSALAAVPDALAFGPRAAGALASGIGAWVGGLFGSPGAAAAADATPSPDPTATPQAAPAREEIASLRTETAKFFREPDGTKTAEVHAGPIHFQGPQGSWEDIDPTLVPSARSGFAWRNRSGPFSVDFAPAARGADMVLLGAGQVSLGLGLQGSSTSSSATVEGNRIIYPAVLPGADLVFEARPGDLKELLVLKEPPADGVSYRFPLSLANLTIRQEPGGQVSLVGPDGKPEFQVPRPWMEDSAVDPNSGDAAFSDKIALGLEMDGNTPVLKLTPDPAWLRDTARTYPVRIDPSVTKVTTLDTFVQSSILNTPQDTEILLKAGTFDSGTTKARSLLKFDVSSLAGKNILSANFSVYENHSFSCSARQVNVLRVTTNWSASVVWGNQPSVYSTPVASLNVAKGYSTSCPDAWITFPVTSLVEGWVAGTYANYGLSIRAANETDSYGWKKFDSVETANNPYLSISYNSFPSVPSSLLPATNTISTDTTPTLSGIYSDPDAGDTGYVQFEVYRDSDGVLITSGNGGTVSPGARSSWTVPTGKLLDGVKYRWRARSFDGVDYSGWTGNVFYTPDVSGPTGPLTAPANEATVSGTITLTASPTDGANGSGVKQVDFYATSAGPRRLIATDTNGADGWSASLDTRTLSEGRAILAAEYTDNLGNASCCAPGAGVAVVVDNAKSAPERWAATAAADGVSLADSDAQVVLATGQLVIGAEDDAVPGRGFDAAFSRGYNSASSSVGILGPGWRASLEDVLVPSFDGSVSWVDGAGRERRFAPATSAGLDASFFNTTDLSGSATLTRVDPNIDFNWGTGSPGAGVNVDNFSARWRGLVSTPTAGTWTFYATSDDGVRVLVDGLYVVNNWRVQSATEVSGQIALGAGLHELTVEYYEAAGGAVAQLSWEGPGVAKQVVPAANLLRATGYAAEPVNLFETLPVMSLVTHLL